MLKSIFGTTLSRIAILATGFLIVLLNARYIGAEGVGTIGLLILGITINILINNFLGGASLIYLVPRHDLFKLYLPACIWALITSALGTIIQGFFKLIPEGYFYHLFFLSFIQALAAINLNVLLGKEQIRTFNVLSMLENLIRLLALAFFIFIIGDHSVMAFVEAVYISSLINLILGLRMIRRYLVFSNWEQVWHSIREMFRYGSMLQFASLFQLLNYRLSYYIIVSYLGRAALGVYSVGVQISESVWIVGRSVALIQYSRISNSLDPEYSKRITLIFFKFTFLLTVLAVAVLVMLPTRLYVLVFQKEFSDVGIVIASLAIGIIAVAISMMFSHYFSGTGRPYHNTINSAIGMVFTLVFGFILIPKYGLAGAGITASISYTMGMLYQLIVFMKVAKVGINDFLFNKSDFDLLKREIRAFRP